MLVFTPGKAGQVLPLLVAAIVFLTALAGAGLLAAGGLARHWRGAMAGATIQVPEADAAAASSLLGPAAHRLTQSELAASLQPWLGAGSSRLTIPLPAVFALSGAVPPDLTQALARVAPEALMSGQTAWQERLILLTGSLRACAGLAAAAVALVAAGMIAFATSAGLSAQQETLDTTHHLGATDGMIAAKFATRAFGLSFAGAACGAALATIMLLVLAQVLAPFEPPVIAAKTTVARLADILPSELWTLLAALPLLAAMISWLTAQATIWARLGRLP